MCLGIPGRVVEVGPLGDEGLREGKVDFGGIRKDINLSFTPEAKVGDYVVVHVGFAIAVLDEAEARATLQYLAQLGALDESAGVSADASADQPPDRDPSRPDAAPGGRPAGAGERP